MATGKWIKVHTAESIFEMDVVKGALDREGVDYTVKEHKDTAYDGLFVLQKGYASFFVREDDESTARAVIKTIKNIPYVAFSDD
jgi:hypothetical protein